jgi:hypothetical protein
MNFKIKILAHTPDKFPSITFNDRKFWMLDELNLCGVEYILDDILPNLEKIWRGELVQDPGRLDDFLIDFYPFGYDATGIDFYKDKSIITYGYDEGKIEVPSEEIYQLMMEWGKYLREWREKQK